MIMTTRQANLLNEIDRYVYALTGNEGIGSDSWAALKNYIDDLRATRDIEARDAGLYCATLKKSAELLGCDEHMVDFEVEHLVKQHRKMTAALQQMPCACEPNSEWKCQRCEALL